MSILQNPFPVTGYHGPEFFCDREGEVKRLYDHFFNGVNTTLISIRRMGKTGLIHHLFHQLKAKKDVFCVYVDVYATQSFSDFVNQFSSAVYQAFPSQKSVGKKLLEFMKSLRPVISFDPLTGQPEVSFDFASPKQQEQSLTSLITFLEGQGISILVAVDEFQQINNYNEKNTEAFLRTLIQPLKNVRFIFSGSSKHILTQMFSDSKRPFFGSTQMLELDAIEQLKYEDFMRSQFEKHGRSINSDALSFISWFTRLHTYYTQVVCNRLFTEEHESISAQTVQYTCSRLLKEQEVTFYQFRNLLTTGQWQVLKAIAKEDKVFQPSSKRFLSQYKIGTPSNVQRAIEALLSKEMIFRAQDDQGEYYRVYDCFLARWLEMK
jgi:uncharacterized protein